ncbi:hypothetical protein [Bifidobacterium favimelis]|uniref:Uncharacterized protein n=1 Tax=Bifidobacterium favimelis TaxID=3122979 RepID=A0ABU8ZQ08_9BIFI
MDEAIRKADFHQGVAVLTIPNDISDHKIEDTFKSTADQYQPSQPQTNEADIDKTLA